MTGRFVWKVTEKSAFPCSGPEVSRRANLSKIVNFGPRLIQTVDFFSRAER